MFLVYEEICGLQPRLPWCPWVGAFGHGYIGFHAFTAVKKSTSVINGHLPWNLPFRYAAPCWCKNLEVWTQEFWQLKPHFLILVNNFDDLPTNGVGFVIQWRWQKKDDDDEADSGVSINASGICICICIWVCICICVCICIICMGVCISTYLIRSSSRWSSVASV